MSIATEITRIRNDKSKIGIKLNEMGLTAATAGLDDMTTAIEGITVHKDINASVLEGHTYSIPKGYHDGSGVVAGLTDTAAEASKYKLQHKTATPQKAELTVAPDQGNYGLSSVTVERIPDAYQDVTQVDATKNHVLLGKKIVSANGDVVVGEMPDNGEVTVICARGNQYSNTIPVGYHNGKGSAIVAATVTTVTPKKEDQVISDEMYYYSEVYVDAIPDKYQDVSGVTAAAANVLETKKFVTANGTLTTGTMPNKGDINGEINGMTTTSFMLTVNGYVGDIEVALTPSIENALKEI